MKTRDIAIGLVVLVVLISAVLVIKKSLNKKNLIVPSDTSIEQKISKTFNGLVIPEDTEKIELKDVSGGESFGIATDTEVLANLPDLSNGYFYQVWSNDSGKLISLGKMRMAKGGYIFEGNLKNKKIVVSKEKIFDNKIEVKILE